MSTFKHPPGRRSAAVYRRRRLTVLAVLVAIVVVIVLLILRPGTGGAAKAGGTPSAPPVTQTPKPTTTSTPGPTAIPTVKASVAGQPCDPAHIDVEAITDASSYRAGARPLLSLSLTNTGTVMCTIDAGTAAMVFTVTSGKEQYWTSTDCQADPVHTVIKLEPNKTLSSTPIAWDRTRSSKSSCDAARPAVPAGGASYHLAVSIDGIASKTTKQFLLYG